jgi:hypothetical protein
LLISQGLLSSLPCKRQGEVFTIPGLPLSSGKAEILAKFRLLPEDKQRGEEIIDGLLQKSMAADNNGAKKKKK